MKKIVYLLLALSASFTLNAQTISLMADSDTLCAGDSTFIYASNGTAYTWSPATGLNTSVGDTVLANPMMTTTYEVIGMVGMNADTQYITIVVNMLPTLSASSSADTLCAGDSATLQVSGANTYVWTPGTGLSSTTGDSIIAKPNMSMNYMVTGTDSNSCTAMANVGIVVNQNPSLLISAQEDTLCSGSSTSLVVSGAETYVWNPTIGLNTPSGDSVVATPSTSTSYTVIGTDSNGCSASASQNIEILSNPSITITAPQFVCVNTPTAISVSGGQSYKWTPANLLNRDTGSSVILTTGINVTLNVEATGANGCKASRGVLVRVNSAPAVLQLEMNERDTNAVEICEGDTVDLFCVGAGAAGVYNWSGTNLIGNTGVSVKANPTTTSTYKVVGNNNGCKDSLNFTINVNPSPSISLSQSSGGNFICKDETDTITVTSNANRFIWNITGSQIVTTSKEKGVAPGITSVVQVTALSDKSCRNTAQITILVDTTCGENLSVNDLFLHDFVATKQIGKQLEWTLSSEQNAQVNVTLYDLNGRKVFESILLSGESIRSRELSEGIYISRFESTTGLTGSQKSLIY